MLKKIELWFQILGMNRPFYSLSVCTNRPCQGSLLCIGVIQLLPLVILPSPTHRFYRLQQKARWLYRAEQPPLQSPRTDSSGINQRLATRVAGSPGKWGRLGYVSGLVCFCVLFCERQWAAADLFWLSSPPPFWPLCEGLRKMGFVRS